MESWTLKSTSQARTELGREYMRLKRAMRTGAGIRGCSGSNAVSSRSPDIITNLSENYTLNEFGIEVVSMRDDEFQDPM